MARTPVRCAVASRARRRGVCGTGVVAETLELSQLAGYRTGGTIHVVINNQLGFTTAPASARSSVYPTDVGKIVQAPIIHVNGDDPEACLRAAHLAFGFRQAFHKDVVMDIVCYRRFGHNEGDDPSYTQPRMYAIIESKRSVRKRYTEVLVRRGDITLDEAEKALDDFAAKLQAALGRDPPGRPAEGDRASLQPVSTGHGSVRWSRPGSNEDVVSSSLRAATRVPEGFNLHPKLARQFEQRAKMVADDEIDWALGEAIALGSVVLEGTERQAHRPGHQAGVPSASATPCSWTTRRAPNGYPSRISTRLDGARTIRRPRLAAVRVRGARIRVRVLRRCARCSRVLGGAVRRLRQRRPR